MQEITKGVNLYTAMLNDNGKQSETVKMTLYCPLNCNTCPSGDLVCIR